MGCSGCILKKMISYVYIYIYIRHDILDIKSHIYIYFWVKQWSMT